MTIALDHLILPVNDRAKSIAFYRFVLGFRHEKDDGPFAMLRVTRDFVILLAQQKTAGGEHLAFSMSGPEFDAVFARLKDLRVPYGDDFDRVGSMQGPGRREGARGGGAAIYFFDPDKHLIEIRHYEGASNPR